MSHWLTISKEGEKKSSPTEEKNMSKRLGPQPLSTEKLALPLFISYSFSLPINTTWLTSPLPVFPNSLTLPMSAKFFLLNHNIPYSQCFQRLIISFLNYKTFKDTPLKKTKSLLIKTHLFARHLMSRVILEPTFQLHFLLLPFIDCILQFFSTGLLLAFLQGVLLCGTN